MSLASLTSPMSLFVNLSREFPLENEQLESLAARIEEGRKWCKALYNFFQERASADDAYGKWVGRVSKNNTAYFAMYKEEPTLLYHVCSSSLRSAEELGQKRMQFAARIAGDICSGLSTLQEEQVSCKKKILEDGKNAMLDLYNARNAYLKAKARYEKCCKEAESCIVNRDERAKTEPSAAALTKVSAKVDQALREMSVSRDLCKESIGILNSKMREFSSNLSHVFGDFEGMEKKRVEVIRQLLIDVTQAQREIIQQEKQSLIVQQQRLEETVFPQSFPSETDNPFPIAPADSTDSIEFHFQKAQKWFDDILMASDNRRKMLKLLLTFLSEVAGAQDTLSKSLQRAVKSAPLKETGGLGSVWDRFKTSIELLGKQHSSLALYVTENMVKNLDSCIEEHVTHKKKISNEYQKRTRDMVAAKTNHVKLSMHHDKLLKQLESTSLSLEKAASDPASFNSVQLRLHTLQQEVSSSSVAMEEALQALRDLATPYFEIIVKLIQEFSIAEKQRLESAKVIFGGYVQVYDHVLTTVDEAYSTLAEAIEQSNFPQDLQDWLNQNPNSRTDKVELATVEFINLESELVQQEEAKPKQASDDNRELTVKTDELPNGSQSPKSAKDSNNGNNVPIVMRNESKELDEEWKSRFQLPASEHLLTSYSCAFAKKILLHGRLFITQHFLCFHSFFNSNTILGADTTVQFKFRDIRSVEKKNSAVIFPNAISITLKSGEVMLFASFIFRDQAYSYLTEIWQSHVRTESLLSPSPDYTVQDDYADDSAQHTSGSETDKTDDKSSTRLSTELDQDVADTDVPGERIAQDGDTQTDDEQTHSMGKDRQEDNEEEEEAIAEEGAAGAADDIDAKLKEQQLQQQQIAQTLAKAQERSRKVLGLMEGPSRFPNLLITFDVDSTPEEVYRVLFSSTQFWLLFYEKGGNTNCTLSDFTPAVGYPFGDVADFTGLQHNRQGSYVHPLREQTVFAPKTCNAVEDHKLFLVHSNEFHLETVCRLSGFPYSDHFIIHQYFGFHGLDSTGQPAPMGVQSVSTRIISKIDARFVKSTIFRGRIERSTVEEAKEVYSLQFQPLVKEQLAKAKHSAPSAVSTPARSRRRSVKASGPLLSAPGSESVVVSPQSEPAAAASQQPSLHIPSFHTPSYPVNPSSVVGNVNGWPDMKSSSQFVQRNIYYFAALLLALFFLFSSSYRLSSRVGYLEGRLSEHDVAHSRYAPWLFAESVPREYQSDDKDFRHLLDLNHAELATQRQHVESQIIAWSRQLEAINLAEKKLKSEQ
eukprot:GILJ01008517.1.p1 GENE.GILJ01008517.1~~GILJ01008517.1.p1  ORF type:complete len:1274 (+),score=212.77 GILJ01008517.1:34-3855(+)